MTLQHLCTTYAVNSSRLVVIAGYNSHGIFNHIKAKPMEEIPPSVLTVLKRMQTNLCFVWEHLPEKVHEEEQWFYRKMHATNISIGSKKVYPLFTSLSKATYYKILDNNPSFCRSVNLYIHTGILLYLGNYDEGLISSQHNRITFPVADNSTRPT